MKQLLIEKTGFWKKLAFGTRWNLRDIMRHKARSSMTLLGIISCTLLIVGVLGMKDTMAAFMDMIDKEINNYVTKVNIAEGADNEEIEAFAKEQKGDWSAQLSIKLGEKAITLDIYETNYDKMRFIDENDNRVTLGDEGAYICIRLADEYEVGDMIEFSPYGSEETYSVKVAGVIRSVMTENITITKEYAEKIGIPYQIGAVYTDTEQGKIADADFISGKQSKQALMDSYNSFMELLDMMVIIFIIGALILGTVVLYNLGVMSYIERSRELATLKVVGFRDKHIGKILISQNVWLTVLGVIVGIPGGAVVLKVLLKMLASEYELCMKMGALTFVVSIVLTFGISLIVGLFVARKNKKIDMVEALKGAE